MLKYELKNKKRDSNVKIKFSPSDSRSIVDLKFNTPKILVYNLKEFLKSPTLIINFFQILP